MSKIELKQDAIERSKEMLAQIPFNSIYSCADTLFDKDELRRGDEALDKEIDFLKNTLLQDIEYRDTESAYFFKIINKKTRKKILFSNRMSTRGELRGAILRQFIDQKKLHAPEQTLFDVLSNAVSDPYYSDMITMLRGILTGNNAKMLYGYAMSHSHFNAFSEELLKALRKKIAQGAIEDNLEPKDIRDNPALLESIWDGIDVARIYDATEQEPDKALQAELEKPLKAKAATLEKKSHDAFRGQEHTTKEPVKPQKPRRFMPILQIGFGLALLIGCILLLSGIFAPIGLAITSAAAITVTALGIGASALLTEAGVWTLIKNKAPPTKMQDPRPKELQAPEKIPQASSHSADEPHDWHPTADPQHAPDPGHSPDTLWHDRYHQDKSTSASSIEKAQFDEEYKPKPHKDNRD